MNIAKTLLVMFPGAALAGDYVVQDNGDGVLRIVRWNEARLGPQPSLEELQQGAPAAAIALGRVAIDAAADRVRLKYVPQLSTVPEYQQAEVEAAAYKAAGYTGQVPPAVSSWAVAKAWTNQQAADDILSAATMLRGKLMQIRSVRLAGKEAMAAGQKTVAQVLAELAAL